MNAKLAITPEEYALRRKTLLERLQDEEIEGFVSFTHPAAFYLTGFSFAPTERPTALVVLPDDAPILFLPHLEIEHARSACPEAEVVTYPEYPGEVHPMNQFAEILRERGLERVRLGTDAKGYGSSQGYQGPDLEAVLPDVTLITRPREIEKMRMVKSEREIELIRESARWGNLAHTLLQEYCAPGRTENEVSMRASSEATQAMMETLGTAYVPQGGSGANTGFRGQIGAHSALPHALNIDAVMREGDNLVTGAGSNVGGYGSELERTMFLGEPSRTQRRHFEYMLEMGEAALDAIVPGEPCSTVDRAVNRVFDRYDLWDKWRHHTGHALGLLGHEAPFFDVGDDTIMEPGMVFSVEPGVYVPGLGGFRHSDTVLVTENGVEMITYYPRDIDSLTIAVH
ncbi:MAG: Xaa-Pro peptidase family protein [Bacillota bacterium]